MLLAIKDKKVTLGGPGARRPPPLPERGIHPRPDGVPDFQDGPPGGGGQGGGGQEGGGDGGGAEGTEGGGGALQRTHTGEGEMVREALTLGRSCFEM